MPYRSSRRAPWMRRAAWARVRTGTGPSWAAMPPKSPRVTRVVRAPSSAARRAAITPAGPAPMTVTFTTSSRRGFLSGSPRVVDDDPEIVALDRVPRLELPMGARAQRPVIPRRIAGFGTSSIVAIETRIDPGGTARLFGELPGRETGNTDLERTLTAPNRLAHSPVHDEVVAGMDSGLVLLEVLLEACHRREAPVSAISTRVPDPAQRVDQRPEPRSPVLGRAGLEASRRRPDRELDLVVPGRTAPIERHRRQQDVAETEVG